MKLEGYGSDNYFFLQWNLFYDNVNIGVGTFYENVHMKYECTMYKM